MFAIPRAYEISTKRDGSNNSFSLFLNCGKRKIKLRHRSLEAIYPSGTRVRVYNTDTRMYNNKHPKGMSSLSRTYYVRMKRVREKERETKGEDSRFVVMQDAKGDERCPPPQSTIPYTFLLSLPDGKPAHFISASYS